MGFGSFLKKAAGSLGGPAAEVGISVGSKLLGGLFGGKSKKKKAEAANKAAIGAAQLKNQMGEDQRLAHQSAGQSLLGQLAGKGFTNIDPATAAALMKRRTYDFSKAMPEAGAGIGSELLSGLFGGIGDVADMYGINKMDRVPTSPGQPVDLSGGIQTQQIVNPLGKLGGGDYTPFATDFRSQPSGPPLEYSEYEE